MMLLNKNLLLLELFFQVKNENFFKTICLVMKPFSIYHFICTPLKNF